MDFQHLITDLLARGLNYRDIGEAAGMTGENIRSLAGNPRQQPRWAAGQAIIGLHKKILDTGENRE